MAAIPIYIYISGKNFKKKSSSPEEEDMILKLGMEHREFKFYNI